MDDFENKLNTLLSDPDSMAKIMQMAQSLSGSMGAAQEQIGQTQSAQPTQSESTLSAVQSSTGGGFDAAQLLSSLTGGVDTKMLSRLMPLLSELGSSRTSETAQLLHALRPFLKAERQEKVERAITLAKIIHLGKKFFTGGMPLV